MNASARTVNGFPLATPRRGHASAGMLRNSEMVARRTWRNSSTCADHATLVAYYADHAAHGPEDTCSDGAAFSGVPLD